ncbi:hypothetical protein [Turneriella parva]|uniref:Uncharacterized protein n=1 Tax=Turneriella parva (strain ATCC BAA-1111 / DSM 21527 / NCTC 11395 / H) TaxID=869212 RepID=I4BBZ1_TURPD|nr:hypothetical protein [Turneriella parva]AFM14798.1 hypothetical protein Turpa_4165 [Turneriella parva DSM 21527]
MADLKVGDKVTLQKPPHIFEGVIIMPGAPAEVSKLNDDGTVDLLYYDREMMPHTMPQIKITDISPAIRTST